VTPRNLRRPRGTSAARGCRSGMRSAPLLLALALLSSAPSPASACENATLVRISQLMRRLDHAESELHAGRTREALRDATWVVNVSQGRAWGYELSTENPAEAARARRLAQHGRTLLALAVIRRDGRVDRRGWRPTSRIPEATRRANLDWALGILESAASRREPLDRARYAEALARYPARRDEARTILAEHAASDTMADPWGYRVLPEPPDLHGELPARHAAITRCQQRAGADVRTVCPRIVTAR